MNPTEMDVLAFWLEHTDSMGFPPSRRKAAAFFDVARSIIDALVRSLHARGLMQAGGAMHLGDAITPHGRAFVAEGISEPIPYVPATPRAMLVVSEAKCACGASHFRLGQIRCFDCARKATA